MKTATTPNGAKLEISFRGCGRGEDEYRVYLEEGEWPDQKTIVDLCNPHNLGGRVNDIGRADCRMVTVYVR